MYVWIPDRAKQAIPSTRSALFLTAVARLVCCKNSCLTARLYGQVSGSNDDEACYRFKAEAQHEVDRLGLQLALFSSGWLVDKLGNDLTYNLRMYSSLCHLSVVSQHTAFYHRCALEGLDIVILMPIWDFTSLLSKALRSVALVPNGLWNTVIAGGV